MKKILSVFLLLSLVLTLAAGCGGSRNGGDATSPANPTDPAVPGSTDLKIVCTVFPQYDWVRNILGDLAQTADLTMLLDTGTDLHSYQATAEDFVKLSGCDLFIYVGGVSDMKWVPDALAAAGNIPSLSLLEALGSAAKEEAEVAGMQPEEEEEEEGALDEHVWLSLRNAQTLVTAICDALCKADPANADTYRANAEAYNKKLKSLDTSFSVAVESAGYKTMLVGDRFPFRYLCDDYGITPYAAFSGCSAETEASFETLAGLSKTVDELGLPAVVVTETADQSIAKTIIENTQQKNQRIVVMNAMQNVTKEKVAEGVTYLGLMQENLAAINSALNYMPAQN